MSEKQLIWTEVRLATWTNNPEQIRSTFARFALPITGALKTLRRCFKT